MLLSVYQMHLRSDIFKGIWGERGRSRKAKVMHYGGVLGYMRHCWRLGGSKGTYLIMAKLVPRFHFRLSWLYDMRVDLRSTE